MRYDEFVAEVRRRGGYPDGPYAERVVQHVLGVLGQRLGRDAAEELAAHLPLPAGFWLAQWDGPPEEFDLASFLERVDAGPGGQRSPGWHASAVLGPVAGAVPPAELDAVLALLPAGFGALFHGSGPAVPADT